MDMIEKQIEQQQPMHSYLLLYHKNTVGKAAAFNTKM